MLIYVKMLFGYTINMGIFNHNERGLDGIGYQKKYEAGGFAC